MMDKIIFWQRWCFFFFHQRKVPSFYPTLKRAVRESSQSTPVQIFSTSLLDLQELVKEKMTTSQVGLFFFRQFCPPWGCTCYDGLLLSSPWGVLPIMYYFCPPSRGVLPILDYFCPPWGVLPIIDYVHGREAAYLKAVPFTGCIKG